MESLDPACPRLRPLAEYSGRLPSSRPGKQLHRATLWRWALKGSNGVVLRTVKLGGSRCTCDAWLCEFIQRLSGTVAPDQGQATSPETRRIQARFGLATEAQS